VQSSHTVLGDEGAKARVGFSINQASGNALPARPNDTCQLSLADATRRSAL
jgi:hypothetical protein